MQLQISNWKGDSMKFKTTVVIRSNGAYTQGKRVEQNMLNIMRKGTMSQNDFHQLRKIGNRLAGSKTRV